MFTVRIARMMPRYVQVPCRKWNRVFHSSSRLSSAVPKIAPLQNEDVFFELDEEELELLEDNDLVHTNRDQKFDIDEDDETTSHGFDGLGLAPGLLRALTDIDIHKPSAIQSQAIPAIMSGSDCLVAAQTGTGKTLTFLLPLIHALRQDEKLPNFQMRRARPRAVILVPSRELATQVLSVAKSLSHHVKFKARAAIGGGRNKARENVDQAIDVLVATPGRLHTLLEEQKLFMSDVRYVVMDEADCMVDPNGGFAELIDDILMPIRSRTNSQRNENVTPCQFLLTGASFNKKSQKLIEREFPGIQNVTQTEVHTSLSKCLQEFIEVKTSNKIDLLMDVLSSQSKFEQHIVDRQGRHVAGEGGVRPTIVFCNTLDSCRAVDYALQDHGFPVLNYHGGIPMNLRQVQWSSFLKRHKQVLVTTDIAARGLDTNFVEHVILFDFPLNPVDYLHRIGRTARAGASGVATSLLDKRDLVLATAIQRANKEGKSLADLSSDKRAYASYNMNKHVSAETKERILRDSHGRPINVEVNPRQMRARARVRGGGKAWMPSNVYQAYMARRAAVVVRGTASAEYRKQSAEMKTVKEKNQKRLHQKLAYKRDKREGKVKRSMRKYNYEMRQHKHSGKYGGGFMSESSPVARSASKKKRR